MYTYVCIRMYLDMLAWLYNVHTHVEQQDTYRIWWQGLWHSVVCLLRHSVHGSPPVSLGSTPTCFTTWIHLLKSFNQFSPFNLCFIILSLFWKYWRQMMHHLRDWQGIPFLKKTFLWIFNKNHLEYFNGDWFGRICLGWYVKICLKRGIKTTQSSNQSFSISGFHQQGRNWMFMSWQSKQSETVKPVKRRETGLSWRNWQEAQEGPRAWRRTPPVCNVFLEEGRQKEALDRQHADQEKGRHWHLQEPKKADLFTLKAVNLTS